MSAVTLGLSATQLRRLIGMLNPSSHPGMLQDNIMTATVMVRVDLSRNCLTMAPVGKVITPSDTPSVVPLPDESVSIPVASPSDTPPVPIRGPRQNMLRLKLKPGVANQQPSPRSMVGTGGTSTPRQERGDTADGVRNIADEWKENAHGGDRVEEGGGSNQCTQKLGTRTPELARHLADDIVLFVRNPDGRTPSSRYGPLVAKQLEQRRKSRQQPQLLHNSSSIHTAPQKTLRSIELQCGSQSTVPQTKRKRPARLTAIGRAWLESRNFEDSDEEDVAEDETHLTKRVKRWAENVVPDDLGHGGSCSCN